MKFGDVVHHPGSGASYVVISSNPLVAARYSRSKKKACAIEITRPERWRVLSEQSALVPVHESMGSVLGRTVGEKEGD